MATSKDDLASIKSLNLDSDAEQASCPAQNELYAVFRLTQIFGLMPVTFEKLEGGRRMRLAPVIWQCLSFFVMTICNSILIISLVTTTTESMKHQLNYGSLYFQMIIVTIIVTTSASVYGAPMRIRSFIKFVNQIHMIKSNTVSLSCNRLIEAKYRFITWAIIVQSLIAVVMSIYEHVDGGFKSVIFIWIFAYQFAQAIVFLTMLQFFTCAKEMYKALRSINEALEELLHSTPKKKKVKSGDVIGASKLQEPKATADTIHNLALLYGTACEEVKRLNESNGFPVLSAFISCDMHYITLAYSAIDELTSVNCSWVSAAIQTYRCIIKMFWVLVLIEPCHFTSVEMERTGELLNNLSLKYNDKAISLELHYFIRYLLLNKVEFSPMDMFTLKRPLLASIAARVTTYLVLIFQFRNLEFSI